MHVSSQAAKRQILIATLKNHIKISFNRLYKKPVLLIFLNLIALFSEIVKSTHNIKENI